MSWRWRGRMNTPWKRSSWRFTRTRRCPRPSPRPRSIRWAEWWTCERPTRHWPRRSGVRHRAGRGHHRDRSRHRADTGAPRQRLELPGKRCRSGARRDTSRPRGRRDLRLAPQPLAGQPVAARSDRRPVGRRSAAARLHRVADRPPARRRWPGGVGNRGLRARWRGQRVGRKRQPRRRAEGSRVTRRTVDVIEAGLVPYGEALEWQRSLAQARLERRLQHDVLRSEEHTSELQSLAYLVCRLLLEKKKKKIYYTTAGHLQQPPYVSHYCPRLP